MIESFISVDLFNTGTIDAHIWTIGGVDYVRTQDIDILNIDEDGIKSALIMSLFTDRRLPFAGNKPTVKDDRRGWWGDNTLQNDDRMGSRLWTLAREKTITGIIIPRAEEIILEALKWMTEDKVAESVKIQVVKEDSNTLSFLIILQRPGEEKTSGYSFLWRNI